MSHMPLSTTLTPPPPSCSTSMAQAPTLGPLLSSPSHQHHGHPYDLGHSVEITNFLRPTHSPPSTLLPSDTALQEEPVITLQNTPSASFTQCLFVLTATCVGASCLTLPYLVSQTGLGVGVFLITTAGFLSVVSCTLLFAAAELSAKTTYLSIAKAAYGNVGELALTTTMFLLLFGPLAATVKIMTNFLLALLQSDTPATNPSFFQQPFFVTGFILCGLFILCSFSSLRILSYTSFLSFLLMSFTAVLVMFSFTTDLLFNPDFRMPPVEWVHTPFNFFSSVLPALSTLGMAYMNHINILEVTHDLKRTCPSQIQASWLEPDAITEQDIRRLQARHHLRNQHVLAIVCGVLCTLIYIALAVSGVLHYGLLVKSNILSSEPITPLFNTARLGIILVLASLYPLLMRPARDCFSFLIDSIADRLCAPSSQGVHTALWENQESTVSQMRRARPVKRGEESLTVLDSDEDADEESMQRIGSRSFVVSDDHDDDVSETSPLIRQATSEPLDIQNYIRDNSAVTTSLSPFRFYALTFVIMGLSLTLSVAIPSLDSIFSLFGAMAGSLIVYIFPALFYLKLLKNKRLSIREGERSAIARIHRSTSHPHLPHSETPATELPPFTSALDEGEPSQSTGVNGPASPAAFHKIVKGGVTYWSLLPPALPPAPRPYTPVDDGATAASTYEAASVEASVASSSHGSSTWMLAWIQSRKLRWSLANWRVSLSMVNLAVGTMLFFLGTGAALYDMTMTTSST